ncbi:MAG: NUDIX hydrolase [Alphaproteobacteria bacterium]|jgi:ADP-ribose pyrophosphatase YjhB (NUDIX family)
MVRCRTAFYCPLLAADTGAGGPQGPVHREVPDGDNRERLVCRDCGYVSYSNPKIVTGSVAEWPETGAILLCRRAIEPQPGRWTLPAGYLELNESTEAGAVREAAEEACASIEIDRLLAIYNVPRISQVQTIYRARLLSPDVAVGEETLEVGLFDWADIPWDEIAFPTVRWALRHYRESRASDEFAPFGNPPDETADLGGEKPAL